MPNSNWLINCIKEISKYLFPKYLRSKHISFCSPTKGALCDLFCNAVEKNSWFLVWMCSILLQKGKTLVKFFNMFTWRHDKEAADSGEPASADMKDRIALTSVSELCWSKCKNCVTVLESSQWRRWSHDFSSPDLGFLNQPCTFSRFKSKMTQTCMRLCRFPL